MILGEISGLVGKVSKLDFKIRSRTRGHFARMVVYVNIDKPLISRIRINSEIQRVEYESLPTICYTCSCYGHVKDLCPFKDGWPTQGEEKELMETTLTTDAEKSVDSSSFHLWMQVERKIRRNRRAQRDQRTKNQGQGIIGSRFLTLSNVNDGIEEVDENGKVIRNGLKGL